MPLFISDEEFSRLSGDTASVAVRADAYIRGVLHELDTVRAKADAAEINAEQNCSLIEQRYLSLTAEFSKLESNASNLQSSLDQCLRDLSGVQAQNHQIHLQSVREMNLLPESNIQLREESKHNFEECQKMRELAQKARAETQNLENLLREREIELESRKKEIEALKTEKDHLNHKVSGLLERSKNIGVADYDQLKKRVRGLQNELKAKWEDEKAILEKSKNDAEKKYDEISEQLRSLEHLVSIRMEPWMRRLEELRVSSQRKPIPKFDGKEAYWWLIKLDQYFEDNKILEEVKEETGVLLLELEKLRLEPQLESAFKVAESTHASLEAERAKVRSFLFTEEEFKSLHLQVREMKLLRESNMQLREENKHNFEKCQKLRELAQKARAETESRESSEGKRS